MKSIKQCYSELLSLTQLFLLREYSLKKTITVDPSALSSYQTKMKDRAAVSSRPSPPLPHNNNSRNFTITPTNLPSSSKPSPIPAQSTPTQPLATQNSQSSLPKNLNTPPATAQNVQSTLPARALENSMLPSVEEIPLPSTTPSAPSPQIKKGKHFSLEPWTTIPAHNKEEFWKISQSLFPEWRLSETIPNDSIAQKNKNAWQKKQEILPVLILSFNDQEPHLNFLKNIAHAISLRLAPARVVSALQLEKENNWNSILNASQLRLVIANDYELYLQPKLMQFYREVPQLNKHFLNQTPLLLLSDPSLYLKEPQLKPLLWRAICNEFAALQS